MALQKFSSFYLDLDKITCVKMFLPEDQPEDVEQVIQGSSVRIGFEHAEVTLYDHEPGYTEFINWLTAGSK